MDREPAYDLSRFNPADREFLSRVTDKLDNRPLARKVRTGSVSRWTPWLFVGLAIVSAVLGNRGIIGNSESSILFYGASFVAGMMFMKRERNKS